MRINICMLATAGLLAVSCTGRSVVTTTTRQGVAPVTTREVVVAKRPPHVRSEARTVAPGPGYVWIGGYWRWTGANYVWVSGHWVPRPRPAAVWVEGHWSRGPGGWIWVEGHWR